MTTRTFPLDGPINLQARLGHATLTVDAVEDATEARVDVQARGSAEDAVDRVSVELAGRTLQISTPRQGGLLDLVPGSRPRDDVDITVRVPAGTAMKISSYFGAITVRGRSGGVDIATGLAPVILDVVDGDLRLRYGGAAARVAEVRGSVTLRSGSGDAVLGAVTGDLSCGCGSGSLDVGSVGGRVRWRAGSGTARLACVHDDVDLASGSGTVSIGLPDGVSVRLDVTAGSGLVASELPIEARQTGSGRAITVRARTGSGDIRLFRAVA
jgi:hypothetical protein